MEHEIIKHVGKLRKEVKNKNHSVWEKIKEILIEIFIIVFAVTLSIWLHNWSEHREQQHEVKEFLTDLKGDLNIDIQNMTHTKSSLEDALTLINAVSKSDTTKDGTTKSNSSKNYSFDLINRETHQGDYESFKSSGKIGYIENKEIKKMIITYYEEEMPITYNVEKIFNQKIIEIIELPDDSKDIFKRKLYLCKQGAIGLIRTYDENIKTAKDIIVAIDKEYK